MFEHILIYMYYTCIHAHVLVLVHTLDQVPKVYSLILIILYWNLHTVYFR